MAGIFLVGLVAFPLLPVAPLPQVDFPDHLGERESAGRQPRDHGLLGRDAAGVLSSRRSPGVSQMTSTSVLGSDADHVQFDLDRNIDAAAQDVQAAIDAAAGQLPKNLPSPPSYRR